MAVELIESLTDDLVVQLHALYQREWWTAGRELEDVRRMLAESDLTLALVTQDERRLDGFCRVLTDFVYHATVYDVIVREDQRGRNLGRRLLDAVVGHPRLAPVHSLRLFCRPEMVPFYEKWGFSEPPHDVRTMWRRRDD